MKVLVFKIFAFLAPLLIFVVCVAIIDPYEYFNLYQVISHEVKQNTSYPLNRRLWKVVAFAHNPQSNILLGDSRTNNLDVRKIEFKTGDKYFNFAYGGGSVPDIITTFWHAADTVKLKKVYIGLNFNVWTDARGSKNSVTQSIEMIRNPLLFFTDISVIKACCYNLYSELIDKSLTIGTPNMTKEAFWKYQLEVTAAESYANYRYPTDYFESLLKIADYCRQNSIDLTFIIYPTHVDLQKRIADFNLVEQEIRFRRDIKKLGPVYDFDYPNEITADRSNFKDPYHSTVQEMIIEKVWGNKVVLKGH